MNRYQYRGRSIQGQAVSGLMEGDSAEAVATRLVEGGITPISIAALPRAAASASADLGQIARRLGLGKPSTSDLVLFTRQMYTVVKSGIPLLRGLRGLAATTHNIVLRDALEDVLRSLESGRSLADSLPAIPGYSRSCTATSSASGSRPARSRRHSSGSGITCASSRTSTTASRARCATRWSCWR